MCKKILLIDDDRALLNTMSRNLSIDYDVSTAEGCAAALEIVKTDGPFSVVFVDMQMPQKNGVETIAEVRKKLPGAVFVMLTGNQDQATAIRAVNDGQVFRFLNKPCDVTEVTAALEAAQKQHDLIVAEKELLEGTFMGTINLMSDIIEMEGNRKIDTRRMSAALKVLSENLAVEMSWKEQIASRICLVGLSWLEPSDLFRFETMDPLSREHIALVNKVFQKSSKMIVKIPRLASVSHLLRTVPMVESYKTKHQHEEVAALCLRVAFYWNFLTLRGLSGEEATPTLLKILPNLNTTIVSALSYLDDNRDSHALTKVKIADLVEGMVPNADIVTSMGEKVFSRGRRLTETMVSNLSRIQDLADQEVMIVANSCPIYQPV